MKVASGFASAPQASRELAEQAVTSALAAADLKQANHVLLLLSREFSRHAAEAIRAAARTAGCLQVSGCTASGLLTEAGWLLDQPAAVALVIGDLAAATTTATPTISFCGRPTLPVDWQNDRTRAGLLETDALTWSHGRLTASACAETTLPGLSGRVIRAGGQRLLYSQLTVDTCSAYELRRVAGLSAVDSLRRALPAEARDTMPLHRLSVMTDADAPPIAILAAHADGSLTLASALTEGQQIAWAMRQPLAAEEEMRRLLSAESAAPPAFALMFSCIGRGPLFYGNEDRDLHTFRQHFPGVPLLGAYGGGQIAPTPAGNRLYHNTAITLLYRSHHV
jgi:small ligand-binding sensory domain FIST